MTYDLTKLKQTRNVTIIEPSVIYRSHYDSRVGVILTPLQVFNEEGLDVRIRMPTKEEITTTPS